jgi:hypothetical protein
MKKKTQNGSQPLILKFVNLLKTKKLCELCESQKTQWQNTLGVQSTTPHLGNLLRNYARNRIIE